MPDFGGFTSCDLDLQPFELTTGTPLTHSMGNIYANSDFSVFHFQVTSLDGADALTDRWRDT